MYKIAGTGQRAALKSKITFTILLTFGLLIRIYLAYAITGASYDINSYQIQAEAVLSGQNIYDVTYRYPYLPLWMYVPALALWIAEQTGWPFHLLVKLPLAIGDLGVSFLLWKIMQQSRCAAEKSLLHIGLLYLFNPAILIITAAHGQFDGLALFFVLLAVWLAEQKKTGASLGGALSLGTATALKGFPILFLPAFLFCFHNLRQALAYIILTIMPPFLLSLPYLRINGTRLTGIILRYSSTCDHSYSYVLLAWEKKGVKWAETFRMFLRAQARIINLLGVAFATLASWWHRKPLVVRLSLIVLSIYILTPGLASQQILWLIPFLLTISLKLTLWYSAVSTVILVLFYWAHFPEVLLIPHVADTQAINTLRIISEIGWWFTCVGILVNLLRPTRDHK
jgi:Gpi18-like mannosyltransferase